MFSIADKVEKLIGIYVTLDTQFRIFLFFFFWNL